MLCALFKGRHNCCVRQGSSKHARPEALGIAGFLPSPKGQDIRTKLVLSLGRVELGLNPRPVLSETVL